MSEMRDQKKRHPQNSNGTLALKDNVYFIGLLR